VQQVPLLQTWLFAQIAQPEPQVPGAHAQVPALHVWFCPVHWPHKTVPRQPLESEPQL
jgi:hypothetical protein